MKRTLLVVFIGLFGLFMVKAQDVIVLKSTEEIQAKVLEIAPNTVKYVEWDFQDGPVRIVNRSDIFVIKYQNGRKEVFVDTSRMRKTSNHGKYIDRIKAQAYFYFGTPIEKNGAGPAIDASFGARFYDYFYLGAELGYACIFEKMVLTQGNYKVENFWMYSHLFSINVNMKGYLPVSEKLFPFINLTMGLGFFPLDGTIHDGQHRSDYDIHLGLTNGLRWFNMQVGAGVDFKRFSVGLGYHALSKNGVTANIGYFKMGIRL